MLTIQDAQRKCLSFPEKLRKRYMGFFFKRGRTPDSAVEVREVEFKLCMGYDSCQVHCNIVVTVVCFSDVMSNVFDYVRLAIIVFPEARLLPERPHSSKSFTTKSPFACGAARSYLAEMVVGFLRSIYCTQTAIASRSLTSSVWTKVIVYDSASVWAPNGTQ